jgi:FAD/FMN-containing dehydrogenase
VDAVTAHTGQYTPFKDAFTNPAPVYGLLEFDTPHNPDAIAYFFDHCPTSGWVCDAIISQSGRQSKELWQLRENISKSLSPHKPLKHDVAVRLVKLPEFIARLEALFAEQFPELESVWFGHLGDGNIHVNVVQPEGWRGEQLADLASVVSKAVYGLVWELGCSLSAEHWVGLLKQRTLAEQAAAPEFGHWLAVR